MAGFLYSERLMDEMEAWMERLLAKTVRGMPVAGRGHQAFENLMRTLVPLL